MRPSRVGSFGAKLFKTFFLFRFNYSKLDLLKHEKLPLAATARSVLAELGWVVCAGWDAILVYGNVFELKKKDWVNIFLNYV